MEYKSTNNYGKAQSKYNFNQKNNSDVLSKIITAYKGLNTYGQLKNTTQTAQFGRKVAEHYQGNTTPKWLNNYMPDANKKLNAITGTKEMAGKAGIEGYAPVEDGLFGMIKNMYSPSGDFERLYDLGSEALSQGKTQLANEGMSAEALSGANEGSMSSVLSSPYAPYIMAILGAGIGAGKQGSTLQNWLNPDGGY